MSKSYQGGCHCGGVRYEVSADLANTIQCNCSICQKTGSILAFAPATDFNLLQGSDLLTDYQFNKKVIHHLFCRICGIRSFARGQAPDGTQTVAINARCLDDVDMSQLSPAAFDGKSF